MNQRYTKAVFTILIWSACTFVTAKNNEIVSGYERSSSSLYCTSQSFLRCLGVDKPACYEAVRTGNSSCITEKLLNTIEGKIDDKDKSLSIIKSESQLYAVCLTRKFSENLSISETKFEECVHHLESVYEEYREKIRREHEQLQKKLDD